MSETIATHRSSRKVQWLQERRSTSPFLPERTSKAIALYARGGFDYTNILDIKSSSRPKSTPSYSEEDWRFFRQLLDQWRKERGATSSLTRMIMCPSYQRIIGLGEKAVPMILRQIRSESDDPDHWNWALTAITGATVVNEEDAGNTRKIATAWLRWARNKYGW